MTDGTQLVTDTRHTDEFKYSDVQASEDLFLTQRIQQWEWIPDQAGERDLGPYQVITLLEG